MFRFYYVIFTSLFYEVYYYFRMNYIIAHPDRYSEDQKYSVVRNVIRILKI